MIYLKNYKIFEMAIIKPYEIDSLIDELINQRPRTQEAANEISNEYGVDIITHDEFTESIKEDEDMLRDVPPKNGKFLFMPNSGIHFAALNKFTRRINLVVEYAPFIRFITGGCPPPLLQIIKSMLGHETIHLQQFRKMGNIVDRYDLEGSPTTDADKYLSSKTEIMAYAFSIVDELKRFGASKEEISNIVKSNNTDPKRGGSWILGWYEREVKDPKVIKRLRKYIYLYLQELFEE